MALRVRGQTVLPVLALFLAPVAGAPAPPAAPVPASERTPVFGSGVELVVVDLVVRDRHGNLVRDLRRDEVDVYEDGVRQQVAEFRSLQSGVATSAVLPATGGAGPAVAPAAAPVAARPRVNLVALVFDQLSVDGRALAHAAARMFVEAQADTDAYLAVFRIDGRLKMACNFTRDKQALLASLERATLGSSPAFASGVKGMSGDVASSPNYGDPRQAGYDPRELRPAHFDGDPGAGTPMDGPGPVSAERGIANAELDILRTAEDVERTQRGNWSLDGLLSVVHGLRNLPGRKTLVHFSEGLQVPPWLEDPFRVLSSEANRGGVSIYAVDVRGLGSRSHLDDAKEMLDQAVRVSESQRLSGGAWQGVTREQAREFDTVEATLRIDAHGTLEDLARSTGGFLIGDNNGLGPKLRTLSEDIHHYYEVAYAPSDRRNDGRFHRLAVRVRRAGAQVQSRQGYFAVPRQLGQPVFVHEGPLLEALAERRPPRAFEHQAAVFRFEADEARVRHAVVAAVPLASLRFNRDEAKGYYLGRVSVLALVKDARGDIVEKLGEDYVIQGRLADLPATRQRRVSFVRGLSLPAGRYEVETAVRDGIGERISCGRIELRVEPPVRGVRVSSLVAVAGAAPAGDGEFFRLGEASLVPGLDGEGPAVRAGDGLAVYFVVYGRSGAADSPRAELEIGRGSRTVRRGAVPLPAADASGRVAHLARVDLEGLAPGDYVLRLTVAQDGSTASERTPFRVLATAAGPGGGAVRAAR
ncbi:MAG TPA: VWA domain-containing protein [Vicinamibacteria bacterium]|nr:VWA domain-containing protein [Vicinamibacteria bacterium]